MRRKKQSTFIAILNTLLLITFLVLGVVFLILSIEDNKDNNVIEYKKLGDTSATMFKNELPKKKVVESIDSLERVSIEDDFTSKESDPEMDYAVKLFESSVNSKFKTLFKKPFNYKKYSSCELEVFMSKNSYKVKNCNADNIFKREVSIAIDKMKPFKRKTYNNINLNNKKLTIIVSVD